MYNQSGIRVKMWDMSGRYVRALQQAERGKGEGGGSTSPDKLRFPEEIYSRFYGFYPFFCRSPSYSLLSRLFNCTLILCIYFVLHLCPVFPTRCSICLIFWVVPPPSAPSGLLHPIFCFALILRFFFLPHDRDILVPNGT